MTEFPLGVVLSAYHNKMIVPFAELRAFLNYMTGNKVALWDVSRARAMVANNLAKQFTWLPEIHPPPDFRVDAGNGNRFVKLVAAEIGTTVLNVARMRSDAFTPRGPFEGERKRSKR